MFLVEIDDDHTVHALRFKDARALVRKIEEKYRKINADKGPGRNEPSLSILL